MPPSARGRLLQRSQPSVTRLLIAASLLAPVAASAAAPQDPDAAARECEAAAQASDWAAAVTHCEAAIGALPDAYGIHYFLGFAYQARQEWEKAGGAFESFMSAVEELPADGPRPQDQLAVAARNAGLAWFRAGNLTSALPLLRRAAAADAADAEVHFFLGVGFDAGG